MRLLELFSGYGSQRIALNRLGIFPDTAISEIDKYAIQAYEQLHGPTKNYGDISKIQEIDTQYDMWTYSFPCQDLSQAGKQAGIKEGTRSGLLYEVERLLKQAVANGNAPTYLLLENVRALVSKRFKPDFDRWLDCLSELGYDNYWQILNAKDFGVPQNRERVFVVSIKRGAKKGYTFPLPFPLKIKLKDVLEQNVDEKYYISEEKARKLLSGLKDSDVSKAIRCGGRGTFDIKHTWDVVLVGGEQKNQAVKTDGISTCLTASMGTGGGYVPLTTDTVAYDEQNQYIRKDGCVGTLTTDGSSPKHNNRIVEPNYRMRKLTPHECWRLMGVSDEDYAKLHDISNSQLYKMAGNSIVVDVLYYIFKNLLED